ncbi:DUF3885 domain-containing protein [Agrobacterium sp. NPDC090273]|uniref:DUF3885 domain-containing protein n=1 Tax=Agrobacterium sp. NPDC090273 TaxID=3363919 RepID=UPI00383AACAF
MRIEQAAGRPTQRVFEVFGWSGFPYALFYQTDFALRFNLGDDISEVPACFLQAMDRSRAILSALFHGSTHLTAVIDYLDRERRTSRAGRSFSALSAMGFKGKFGPAERTELDDEDCEDRRRYWHEAEFPNDPDQINALLWASITQELPMEPRIRKFLRIHIVDFQRGIAATAYDDRGMDIVALNRATLQPLYDQFGTWLLDYDRSAMDRVFAAG